MSTKEEIYRKQMKALGIYEEIFEPEISTLAQIEREYKRAKTAWSKTAPPKGKPSMLHDLYPVVMRLRSEMLQHREALGLTPRSLRKLRGAQSEGPDQRELISAALDRIADSVAGFDGGSGSETDEIDLDKLLAVRDAYADLPGFEDAQEISEKLDAEDYDLKQAVAEDMG
jgi:hypothetical protein